MILERVFQEGKPYLKDRTIRDLRIGLELLALQLDDGSLGVTYVLKNELEHSCGASPFSGKYIGMSALELAEQIFHKPNVLSTALAIAALNAVAPPISDDLLQKEGNRDAVFSVDVNEEDTVGVVGHIGPVIRRLKNHPGDMHIFERDLSKGDNLKSENKQATLLPQCDVVFVTGATIINGSLENVLSLCTKAREIVLVGSSAPIYPKAFTGSGVTVLAGTRWLPENGQEILTGVSQSAGMQQLIKYGKKLSLSVPKF
ncbi:MAG: DUF364 domain-containing protein [Campylobacteraceae bacterium]|nr:DUF364 domain-containing protein [Campylobacteraceae bacterium]